MDEEIQKALGKQEQESRFFMPDEFYDQHSETEEDTKQAAIQSLIQPVAKNIPSFMDEQVVSQKPSPSVNGNDPALVGFGDSSFDLFPSGSTVSQVPYAPFQGAVEAKGIPFFTSEDSDVIDTSAFMPQAAPTSESDSSFGMVNEVPFAGATPSESSTYDFSNSFSTSTNPSGGESYSAMSTGSFVAPSIPAEPVPASSFSSPDIPSMNPAPARESISSNSALSMSTGTGESAGTERDISFDQGPTSFGIEPSFTNISNLSPSVKEAPSSGYAEASIPQNPSSGVETASPSPVSLSPSFSPTPENVEDISIQSFAATSSAPTFSERPHASTEPSFYTPPVSDSGVGVPPTISGENVEPETVMPSFVVSSDSSRESRQKPSFAQNATIDAPSGVPVSPPAESNIPYNSVSDPVIAQAYREQATEGILTNPFISEEPADITTYKAGSGVSLVEEPYTEDGLFVQPEEESSATKTSRSAIQNWINKILRIPSLDPVKVDLNPSTSPSVENDFSTLPTNAEEEVESFQEPVISQEEEHAIHQFEEVKVDYDHLPFDLPVVKSTLLEQLRKKSEDTATISILARYGEDFCAKDYVTNPAIGRSEEIRQLILILLTPEKSGILTGKPGIGKTSIVEGLAYQLQRNNVPEALKGYTIISVKTPSLLGTLPTGETRLQTLVDELKELDKVILFIDEIHMLIGATNESSLDFANMFKEALGRGKIKIIGATTTEEYERYILRDKAFVRRFQKVEVEEPSRDLTIQIMMGTLPKLEQETGAKMKYTAFQQGQIMGFIVDITSEYRRIYGIGSRYPDICLTLLAQAFSHAVFENRTEVNIFDIRSAIENSKNIYPDVIRKELPNFDVKFKDMIAEEMGKSQT